MRISLAWYWRNAWVGVRWSMNRKALYFNIIPFLSFRIEFAPSFIRDPENECEDFVVGDVLPIADCETDGHYLCNGCEMNMHRNEEEE